MEDNIKMITCPFCGEEIEAGKYCSACGATLPNKEGDSDVTVGGKRHVNVGMIAGLGGMAVGGGAIDPTFLGMAATASSTGLFDIMTDNDTPDDKGLTLLVDYCDKVTGTPGYNSRKEYVLYKREETGTLEMHYYQKNSDAERETHIAFKADENVLNQLNDLLDRNQMASYENKKGNPTCGGDKILKFKYNDRYIRLSSENVSESIAASSAMYEVQRILSSVMSIDRRLYKE